MVVVSCLFLPELVLDVLPELSLVVAVPDVVCGEVESPLECERAGHHRQRERRRALHQAVVQGGEGHLENRKVLG